jgi:hypothetical protein
MTGYTYTTLLNPPAVQLVPGVQHNVLPLLLALPHVTAVHVHLVLLLPRQLVQHLLPNTRVGGQLEQGACVGQTEVGGELVPGNVQEVG